jgi:DNA-directed RNA polymerase subunit M/transcription elongation factor TFIIS
MHFCPNCGKIATVRKDGINRIECKCGFSKLILEGEDVTFEEKIPERQEIGKGAVEKKHDLSGFPHECRKCGHGEAEAIELGVFYGDEAGVYLFKCKKCGYSERQSDGTGN